MAGKNVTASKKNELETERTISTARRVKIADAGVGTFEWGCSRTGWGVGYEEVHKTFRQSCSLKLPPSPLRCTRMGCCQKNRRGVRNSNCGPSPFAGRTKVRGGSGALRDRRGRRRFLRNDRAWIENEIAMGWRFLWGNSVARRKRVTSAGTGSDQ